MDSAFQQINAPCPGCRYNLRGRIKFDGVTECPECGNAWRIDELMLQQYAVPRFRWTYLLWSLLPGTIFSIALVLRDALRGTVMETTLNAVYPFVSIFCICLGPVAVAMLCWGAFETISDTHRAPAAMVTAILMIVLNVAMALAVASVI